MANTIKSSTGINKVHAVNKSDNGRPYSADQEKISTPNSSDQIKISKTLESIRSMSAALADGVPIDQNKVEQIRNAIRTGEYSIDTDRIAKKFLELERILDK